MIPLAISSLLFIPPEKFITISFVFSLIAAFISYLRGGKPEWQNDTVLDSEKVK